MVRVRRSVRQLGPGWPDEILWYARAVARLKLRPLDDITSWRFLAAMHGFDEPLWTDHQIFTPGEARPVPAVEGRFWDQCQHFTWYFLPWHRGYLAAFEAIIRREIQALGGPADSWALPYWNYHDAADAQATWMPDPFVDVTWPDGGDNPLKVPRGGANADDGQGPTIDPSQAPLDPPLLEPIFNPPQTQSGGSPGFGGPITDFVQYGEAFGLVEATPHGVVHVQIGGDRILPDGRIIDGIMSHPETAAFDPIFWLHHCNIDRLWEVWLGRDPANANPSDLRWLDGPVTKPFTMPAPDGTEYSFVPRGMLDTSALDYVYDDVSDPLGGRVRIWDRLERLTNTFMIGDGEMAEAAGKTEVIAANEGRETITDGASTTIRFDPAKSKNMAKRLSTLVLRDGPRAEPDRLFLNLEGVRSTRDALLFDVFVKLPVLPGQAAGEDRYIGTIPLFGATRASRPKDAHGGAGVNQVLEITDQLDEVLAAGEDIVQFDVKFVPTQRSAQDAEVTVERVSVVRQGA